MKKASTATCEVVKQIDINANQFYFVIGTIQQAQKLAEHIGKPSRVIFHPDDPCSVALRLDDIYGESDEIRIIVLSADSARGLENVESVGLTFMLLDSIGVGEGFTIDRLLNLKTKAAEGIAKKHTTIDLRKVTDLANVRSAIQEYYWLFPYVAEGIEREGLSDEEVMSEWEWMNGTSVINRLYGSLLSVEGLEVWRTMSSSDYFKMMYGYQKYEEAGPKTTGAIATRTPVVISSTYQFFAPVMQRIRQRGVNNRSGLLHQFALWVWCSSNVWNSVYEPGLADRISKAGYRYLVFTPSRKALSSWLEVLNEM